MSFVPASFVVIISYDLENLHLVNQFHDEKKYDFHISSKFQVFLIEERVSKVKHLHFVSSVPPITYWVSALLWDMFMYLVTSIIVRNH